MSTLLQLGSPAVTIVAIVAAAVCAVIAWQTVRTARRQTADRVAALAAAIYATEPDAMPARDAGEARPMFSGYDAGLSNIWGRSRCTRAIKVPTTIVTNAIKAPSLSRSALLSVRISL